MNNDHDAGNQVPEKQGPKTADRSDGWKPRCFNCRELGHVKAQCEKPKAIAPVNEERSFNGNEMPIDQPGDICCSVSAITSAGTVADKRSPYADVVVNDIHGKNLGVQCTALLYTGAQITCCTRRFANQLFRPGIVEDRDIERGSPLTLALADMAF